MAGQPVDAADVHRRACREFGSRVQAIPGDAWDLPTPCTEWDVRMLVNHLVYENRWIPPLVTGRTIAEVGDTLEGDLLGDDPKGAWSDSVEEATAVLSQPGALEREVELSSGPVKAADYALEVASDLVVHAWDLARAIGTDDRLDPQLVEIVLERAEPQREQMLASGAFGDHVEAPPGADRQTQLLAIFGRRA